MRVLKLLVFIFLISCSPQQSEDQEKAVAEEILAVNNDLETINFSDRFESEGKDSPIWVDRQDLNIEDYIESVDTKYLTIEGKQFDEVNSENIAKDLNLEIDENLTSDNIKIFKSKDEKIVAVIQEGKITSIDTRKDADLKLNGKNIFELTFKSYKDKFSGSYKVRNFKPNISNVSYYNKIDSVRTLDFTELHSQTGKLNFTWVNGYLIEVCYTNVEW